MYAHRKATRSVGMLAAGLFVASTGCRPIVFEDATALAIEGTPPAVEAPPPPVEKRVEVRDNKIVINEKVQFEFDSAQIREVSFDLLNEVASVIKENPQIKKIEVQGHASAEGKEQHNMGLSNRRAKSVRKYLLGQGIEENMLEARGYGETQLLLPSDPENEQNRRVEFVIVEQEITKTKVEIDDEGNETVIDKETLTE